MEHAVFGMLASLGLGLTEPAFFLVVVFGFFRGLEDAFAAEKRTPLRRSEAESRAPGGDNFATRKAGKAVLQTD